MPGIFGLIRLDYNQERVRTLIQGMTEKLRHLEFYESDCHIYGKVGLGKVDVTSRFHNGIYVDFATNIIVSLHGDIFEYVDLGRDLVIRENLCPEEAIATIYKKFGTKTPEKLNGDFNVSIYDPQKDRLLVFNDRFGFRHMYIYQDNDIFIFAPEIKAFTLYPQFDKTLDEHGVADYFNFSYHMGNRTMFKKAKLLPAASCLVVSSNKVKLTTYWEAKYKNELRRSDLSECVDTGYQLFVKSVERRVKNCKHALIPLSGGLDSRLILAVAVELGCNITTATFGSKECIDYKIAQKVCSILGIDMPYLVAVLPDWIYGFAKDIILFDECNYSSLGLTTQHGFANMMGQDYDCFLNGIFGGHLTFGSPYFTEIDLHASYSPQERTNRIIRGLDGHSFEVFLKNCVSSKLETIVSAYREITIHEEWKKTQAKSELYAFRQDSLFLENRIRRCMNVIDQNRFFYNDQLPFASYELYDFYLTLSPELTLNHYLYKEIYKRKLSGLARIPWQSTGMNLYQTPSWINKTKKDIKRYLSWYLPKLSWGRINYIDNNKDVDFNANYRKNSKMRSWIKSILLDDVCLGRGYFQEDGIVDLLKKARNGSVGFDVISKLIIFELWAQKFLDQ